jgi:hypothetical protein
VNPFSFLLYGEETIAPGVLEMRYARYDLLRGRIEPSGDVKGFVDDLGARPIQNVAEAIGATYKAALERSWVLGETNRFAKARPADRGFEVFWYSLELSFWGRSAGVLANVESASGNITVRSAWRNPDRFGP